MAFSCAAFVLAAIVERNQEPWPYSSLWTPVPLEDDPFNGYAPPEVICPLGGFEAEGEGADQILEIDTGICNFITLEQPLPRKIREGDKLGVVDVASHAGIQ